MLFRSEFSTAFMRVTATVFLGALPGGRGSFPRCEPGPGGRICADLTAQEGGGAALQGADSVRPELAPSREAFRHGNSARSALV